MEETDFRRLMTDVLEDKRNLWLSDFSTQQVIMIVLELRIRKMVPAETR